MKPLIQIILLLLAVALQSCAATSGVESTDLSAVQVGATLVEVEKILGHPTQVRDEGDEKIATYSYNEGTEAFLDDRDLVYGTLSGVYLILFTAIIDESTKRYERQRGTVDITYGSDNRVRKVKIISPDRKMPRDEPIVKPDVLFEICRDAHRENAEAQFMMGNLYWFGIGTSEDRIEGFKWYNLAATNGHSIAKKKVAERKSDLSSSEITEAKILLENWVPSPDRCEALAGLNSALQ